MQFFTPGIDMFTAPLVPASFDQLVRAASFYTAGGIGGIIVNDSAPDVVTNPELATFLWLESVSSTPNGNAYYFNGTTWESLLTFDGAAITDGTITPAKLSIAGANAFDILQVNAGATAFVLTNIISAIQNGTLTLNKISPAPGAGYILSSNGGGTAWQTIATIVAAIAANTIPVNSLVLGPARNVLVSDGILNTFTSPEIFIQNYLLDNSIPLAKLVNTGAVAYQSIRRNVGNTAWEFYTPPSASVNSIAILIDRKATGNVGGAFLSGAYRTRDLNTILVNQDAIISGLSSNQFTFGQAGTYKIRCEAPASQVDAHQAQLWSIGGTYGAGAEVCVGTSEDTTNNDGITTRSIIQFVLENLVVGDTFSLRHKCFTTGSFGVPANIGNSSETYSTVEIQRLS